MSLILEATELKKYYGSGSNLVKAVDDISFSVEKGEFVAIVGKSGSGKSTLLNLIGGLDSADSGSVMIQGKELFDLSEEERTVFRRRNIGFVFQNYNLLPTATVYKNIILPIQLDNKKVEYEIVDNKYIGFPITTGTHQISVSFKAPGKEIGTILTIVGIISSVIVIYLESKRKF